MAQFDVFKNPRKGSYPLLLDVQSEVLARLSTRTVVPLMEKKRYGAKPMTRLNPIAQIEGVEYVLVFQELAAIPVTALGAMVTSLQPRRPALVAALDLLFTGL